MAYTQKLYLDGEIRQIDFHTISAKYGNEEWVNSVNMAGETPLHIVARYNNLQLFASMLPFYSDFESTDRFGNTVLHFLVDHKIEECIKSKQKRIELIRTMISKGIVINRRNENGWTLVLYAAKHGHIDMLKLLKKYSASFVLRTNTSETPLLLACKYILKTKITLNEVDLIYWLIDNIIDLNVIDKEGYLALYYAVEKVIVNIVIHLLKNNADLHLNSVDYKITPLYLAIKQNYFCLLKLLLMGKVDEIKPSHHAIVDFDIVKNLIDNGVDKKHHDKIHKLISLRLDFYKQHSYLFKLAMKKIADVSVKSKDDLIILKSPITEKSDIKQKKNLISQLLPFSYTPDNHEFEKVIELLLRNGSDVNALTWNGESSLNLAVKLNLCTIVKIILKYKADINLREVNSKLTSLHLALINKFDEISKLLITNGAYVHALTPDGKSPIMLTLETNRLEILEHLINAGANIEYKEPGSELTLLHRTLIGNQIDAAKCLINLGADVNALTPDGKSPLHYALEHYLEQVLESLILRGAKLNCEKSSCLYTLLFIAAKKDDEDLIDKLNDCNKTPLVLAIDNGEKRDVKKAIYLLSALVQARNEESCMPANNCVNNCNHDVKREVKNTIYLSSAIVEVRSEKSYIPANNYCWNNMFNCLVYNCKMDPNDIETYNKFITYRVLSGTFNDFQDNRYACNKIYLSNYLSMFNAVGLSEMTKSYKLVEPTHQSIGYREKCVDEVKKLKAYIIENNVTLYDVIHMKPRRSRFYINNLDLATMKDKFSIYYKLISMYYYESKIKTVLIDTFQWAFVELTKVNLPIPCLDEIFWNLDAVHIIAMIQAAEKN